MKACAYPGIVPVKVKVFCAYIFSGVSEHGYTSPSSVQTRGGYPNAMPRYTLLVCVPAEAHCPHQRSFYIKLTRWPDVMSPPFMPLPVIFLFLCLSVLRGQQVALPEGRGELTCAVIAHGLGHSGAMLSLSRAAAPLPFSMRCSFMCEAIDSPYTALKTSLSRRVHKAFVRKILNGDALLRGQAAHRAAPRRLHLLDGEALELCPAASPSTPRGRISP